VGDRVGLGSPGAEAIARFWGSSVPICGGSVITDVMVQVLSTSKVQETLRQRGLARAREFSPQRTAERVLALLRAVSEAARQT